MGAIRTARQFGIFLSPSSWKKKEGTLRVCPSVPPLPVLVQLHGPEATHFVVGLAKSVGQLALRGPQPPQHVCGVMVVKGPPVVGVDVAHVGPCRS